MIKEITINKVTELELYNLKTLFHIFVESTANYISSEEIEKEDMKLLISEARKLLKTSGEND